jgi:hypothetical protein
MNLSNVKAVFGLNGIVTPVKSGSSGRMQVGKSNKTLNLTTVTKKVCFDAVIVGSGSDLVIDISDLDATGSTSWTAGAAQVETAGAIGGITAAGNASVVVTAAGMTGSPKTIAVAVALSDTAATWAGKVRAALTADSAVAALFTVSGSGTAVVLTRKPINTYTVNGVAVNVYPANDATMNISLDNGTCTGITTAATSTNTTAGVLTAGVYAPDLNGTDAEGNAIGGLSVVKAVYIENNSLSSESVFLTQGTVLVDYELGQGVIFQVGGASSGLATDDILIETGADALVTITLAGS